MLVKAWVSVIVTLIVAGVAALWAWVGLGLFLAARTSTTTSTSIALSCVLGVLGLVASYIAILILIAATGDE